MEYLAGNVIGAIPWLFFYFRRPDLRKMMLVMSILALPLAFFDLLYVPTYWIPETFLNIPIGIEGFIFSFEVGGFASPVFAYFFNQKIIKLKSGPALSRFIPLIIVLPSAYLFNILFPLNITVGMHVGLLLGTLFIILIRRDLMKSVVFSGLIFAIIYFACLLVWGNLFPRALDWFVFKNLPKLFPLNVPLYEVTFGFLFGGFWGNLYQLLFGYKFVRK